MEWYNTGPKSTLLGELSIGCVGHSPQHGCKDDKLCDVQGSKGMMVVLASGCLINIEIEIEAPFPPHSGTPKESGHPHHFSLVA